MTHPVNCLREFVLHGLKFGLVWMIQDTSAINWYCFAVMHSASNMIQTAAPNNLQKNILQFNTPITLSISFQMRLQQWTNDLLSNVDCWQDDVTSSMYFIFYKAGNDNEIVASMNGSCPPSNTKWRYPKTYRWIAGYIGGDFNNIMTTIFAYQI